MRGCLPAWSRIVVSSSLQEIVCLLGQPVEGNPTQFMMERVFAQLGLDWRYLTLETAAVDLADALRGVRALGFRGCNLSAPHLLAAAGLVDAKNPAAELCGAVNVITRDDRGLRGDNTVGQGFIESLRTMADPAGKRVVILGAGATARAIAAELVMAGAAHLTVVDRQLGRAEEVRALLRDKLQHEADAVAWHGDFTVPPDTDLLVHATSAHQHDLDLRLPIKWPAGARLVVADTGYNPVEPRLLREAKDRGYPTLAGLQMFVNQSALALKLWSDIEPDRAFMRDAVEEFFG